MAVLRCGNYNPWNSLPFDISPRFKPRYTSIDNGGRMECIKPLEWGAKYSQLLLGPYQRSTFGPTFERDVLVQRQRGIQELLTHHEIFEFFKGVREFEFYLHPQRKFSPFPAPPFLVPSHPVLQKCFEELCSLELFKVDQRPADFSHIEGVLEKIQKYSEPYLGAAIYIKEAEKRGTSFSPVSFTDSGIIEFLEASIPLYRVEKSDVNEFTSGVTGTSFTGPNCERGDEDNKELFTPISIRYDFAKKGNINKGPQKSGKTTSMILGTVCISHAYSIGFAPSRVSEMGHDVFSWKYIRSAPRQKAGESGLSVICSHIAMTLAKVRKPSILFLEDVISGGTSVYGIGEFLKVFDEFPAFSDVFLVMNTHQQANAFDAAIASGRYTGTTFDLDHSQHPLGYNYRDNAREIIVEAFNKTLNNK